MMDTVSAGEDLRQRVERERLRRGLSIRRVAALGHVSNTLWGYYEAGEVGLSPKMQQAVADAFGWSADWPSQRYSEPTEDVVSEIRETVADLVARVSRLEEAVSPPSDRRPADIHGSTRPAEQLLRDELQALRHELSELRVEQSSIEPRNEHGQRRSRP
jgi:transcriptional regulator with XRE-family HTH domain